MCTRLLCIRQFRLSWGIMVLTCPSVIIIIIIIINIFVKRHRQSYRGADLGRLSVRSFIRPSVRSSVRLFVCPSVCPSVRLLPNLWTRYFENKWTEFAGNWHKWSMGQGYKAINFDQMVKVQGHTTPKLDLEAWRRHHSWSVRSSRFSSYNILWGAICDREKNRHSLRRICCGNTVSTMNINIRHHQIKRPIKKIGVANKGSVPKMYQTLKRCRVQRWLQRADCRASGTSSPAVTTALTMNMMTTGKSHCHMR